MKKMLGAVVLSIFAATQLSAAYIVVLKDGTQYKAKQRWTVTDGKALLQLESGSVLQLDPNMNDVAKTNEVNKLGLGDVKVLGRETRAPGAASQTDTSLGSSLKLRKPAGPAAAPTPQSRPTAPPVVPAGRPGQGVGFETISKFEAAYENVKIFEHAVASTAPGKIRANLTADNEDRVFDAITATAYLIIGLPATGGEHIDSVELYMQTTTRMPAGRFLMTRADAELINSKKLTPANYFVQKVLY